MSAPSNKEKHSEVFINARWLSDQISRLKRQSWALLIFDILTLLFLPIYIVVLNYLLNYRDELGKTMIIILISILLAFFFVVYLLKNKIFIDNYSMFLIVQREWNELSDKVDWTEMRKKQLYDQLDVIIQKPIDDFSRYRSSLLCPLGRGRKMHNMFGLLFFIELFASSALTISYLF